MAQGCPQTYFVLIPYSIYHMLSKFFHPVYLTSHPIKFRFKFKLTERREIIILLIKLNVYKGKYLELRFIEKYTYPMQANTASAVCPVCPVYTVWSVCPVCPVSSVVSLSSVYPVCLLFRRGQQRCIWLIGQCTLNSELWTQTKETPNVLIIYGPSRFLFTLRTKIKLYFSRILEGPPVFLLLYGYLFVHVINIIDKGYSMDSFYIYFNLLKFYHVITVNYFKIFFYLIKMLFYIAMVSVLFRWILEWIIWIYWII